MRVLDTPNMRFRWSELSRRARVRSVAGSLAALATSIALSTAAGSEAAEPTTIAVDRGFGQGGTLVTRRIEDIVSDPVAISPKGGFAIAGGAHQRAYVERFNSRGRPARTFGANSIARVGLADKYQPRMSIAFDPRGRLLIALDSQQKRSNTLKIIRLTRLGRPDAKFGRNGATLITPPGEADASDAWFTFDRSGSISLVESGRLWRLTSSGRLDERIGPGGMFRPIECGDENRPMKLINVEPAARDGSLYVEKFCAGPDQSIRVDRDGNETPAFPAAPLALDMRTTRDARGGFIGVVSDGGPNLACEEAVLVRIGIDGRLDTSFGTGGRLTRRAAGIRLSSNADSPEVDMTLLRDGTVWVFCGEGYPDWPHFRVSASELAPTGKVKSFVRSTKLTLTGVQIEHAFADPRGAASMLVWGYKKRGISLTRLKVRQLNSTGPTTTKPRS